MTNADLSLQELLALSRQINESVRAKQEEERKAIENLYTNIAGSVHRLSTLIGEENSPPYNPKDTAAPTIRSVRMHSDVSLAKNSGLALSLILAGLEELASTTKDIAIAVDRRTRASPFREGGVKRVACL